MRYIVDLVVLRNDSTYYRFRAKVSGYTAEQAKAKAKRRAKVNHESIPSEIFRIESIMIEKCCLNRSLQ
jgi:hypothetical protein